MQRQSYHLETSKHNNVLQNKPISVNKKQVLPQLKSYNIDTSITTESTSNYYYA